MRVAFRAVRRWVEPLLSLALLPEINEFYFDSIPDSPAKSLPDPTSLTLPATGLASVAGVARREWRAALGSKSRLTLH
jgi:hypothetical protein